MPKRGSLKSAGKRQESATFLQSSFCNVAVQFFACCTAAFGQNDIRTAEKQMLQCNFCSASSAAQHSENCSATSVFACDMLQGWGLEGWGLGLADPSLCGNSGDLTPSTRKSLAIAIVRFWCAKFIFHGPLEIVFLTGTLQQILKAFHRPKCAPQKVLFSPRGSAGVAMLRFWCAKRLRPGWSLVVIVVNQGGPGSVRFGYGSGVERFERFRFSVPAVPLQKGFFCCVSVQFNRKGRFRFRFLGNGSGGSGSAFGFGKKRFRRFRLFLRESFCESGEGQTLPRERG